MKKEDRLLEPIFFMHRAANAADKRRKNPIEEDEKVYLLRKWCQEADSNRRHRDFQSLALPTELPWPIKNIGALLTALA